MKNSLFITLLLCLGAANIIIYKLKSDEISVLKEDLTTATKTITIAEGNLNEQNQKVEAIQIEIDNKDNEINNYKRKIGSIKNEYENKISQIEQKFNTYKTNTAEIERANKDYKTKEERVQKWLEGLQDGVIKVAYSGSQEVTKLVKLETKQEVWLCKKAPYKGTFGLIEGLAAIHATYEVLYGVELPNDLANNIEITPDNKLKIRGAKPKVISCAIEGNAEYVKIDYIDDDSVREMREELNKVARKKAENNKYYLEYAKLMYEARMEEFIQSIIDSTKPDGIPQYKHIKVQLD